MSEHGSVGTSYDARAPRAEIRAQCPCKCSHRPTAAGIATGFGWAMISAAPVPEEREGPCFALDVSPFPPDSLPDPIEHVPLAA